MSLLPTREQLIRTEERQKADRRHFEFMRTLGEDRKKSEKKYNKLKGVATSAHEVIKAAMPYVGSAELKQKMKGVLELLDIWGAHP